MFCQLCRAQNIVVGGGSTTTSTGTPSGDVAGTGSEIYGDEGRGSGGGTYRVGSTTSPPSGPLTGPGTLTILGGDGNPSSANSGYTLLNLASDSSPATANPEGVILFADQSTLKITGGSQFICATEIFNDMSYTYTGTTPAATPGGPSTGTYGTHPGQLNLNGGTTTIDLSTITSQYDFTQISAQIANGNLIINGGSQSGVTNQLVFTTTGGYTNTYNNTTLNGNVTLQLGFSGVTGTTGFGSVTVNSGATLAGFGTVLGTAGVTNHAVNQGGIISPGESLGFDVGTLTVTGNLTLTLGAILNLQANDTAKSAANLIYDKLIIKGSLTLNAGTQINLVDARNTTINDSGLAFVTGTFAANAYNGEELDLLSFTSLINNGFNIGTNFRNGGTGGGTLNLPTLGSGLVYDLRNFLTNGSILISTPEPGRVALLVCGVVALGMRRRRVGQ